MENGLSKVERCMSICHVNRKAGNETENEDNDNNENDEEEEEDEGNGPFVPFQFPGKILQVLSMFHLCYRMMWIPKGKISFVFILIQF